MWARQLAEQVGVVVPNQAAEHYYAITDAMPDVDPDWPVIEDPERYTYLRPEGGGMMIGLFEGMGAPWHVDAVPDSFAFGEIEPDLDRVGPYFADAMSLMPSVESVGMKKWFCGPESFTPDLQPIVGEAPNLRNYWVAAGLNSIGILSGGGLGRIVAHWMTEGVPDVDVTAMNIDRFHGFHATPAFRAARVGESLGNVYTCHYPAKAAETARNVKRSALYPYQVEARAAFREISGWEAPDFFAPEGEVPSIKPYSFDRHHWFPRWEAEHRACREAVAIFDMSFMSKFLVQGDDAGAFLDRVATARITPASPDEEAHDYIRYTQFLRDDGGIEADVTVARRASDGAYLVVVTDTMHGHVETLLRRGAADWPSCVTVTDVTGGLTQINLQGPKSRELLSSLTLDDVSNDALPYLGVRDVAIGTCVVRVSRVTYVGELGYELLVPVEQTHTVMDAVLAASPAVGARFAGLRALSSLRLEKGYRDYGHDLDNLDTLRTVGLQFTAALDKEGGFVGQEAVEADRARSVSSLPRRLVSLLLLDPLPLLHGAEPLVCATTRRVVGEVRVASYGHTLGGAVGLAMVERDEFGHPLTKARLEKPGAFLVNIEGDLYPVKLSLAPLYDPENKRVRA